MEVYNTLIVIDRNTAIVNKYQESIQPLKDSEELYYLLNPHNNAPTILDESGNVIPYRAALHNEWDENLNHISQYCIRAEALVDLSTTYEFLHSLNPDCGADYIIVLDNEQVYTINNKSFIVIDDLLTEIQKGESIQGKDYCYLLTEEGLFKAKDKLTLIHIAFE